jgi:Domain of unknown function (DUF4129)
MASSKPRQTLGDYVTIALSPLLIMALVGSLVFFLLEVLYVGQYSGRLQWTLFFFVFAMVLIARISIELGSERAGLYAIVLGLVVFVALQRFVEYPPDSPLAYCGWLINLGLMALGWWSAHRLTWDCTYVDDNVDASGKGVLEAAGLDEAANAPQPAGLPDRAEANADSPHRNRNRPALIAWWDRYRRYREERSRNPHTPGVWVVYFSLAALPLFGLGQALIPANQPDRRQYTFWLMAIYVASGLGLLLTTSYLGLRRYLRQRRMKMPVAMTGMWLALGGSLIVVLLVLGALLPRPYAEYKLIDFTPLGSKERSASRYALKQDSSGKEQGRASTDTARDDQKAEQGSGTKSDPQGEGQRPGKGSAQGKSGRSGSDSGKSGNQSGGQSGKSGKSNSSNDRSQSDEKRRGQQPDRSDSARDGDLKRDKQEAQEKKDRDAEKKKGDRQNQGGGSSSSSNSSRDDSRSKESGSSRSSASNPISALSRLGSLASVLKWLVFAALAVAVIFFLLRSGLSFLANFTNWARRLLDWWAGLFSRRRKEAGGLAQPEGPERIARPRPFAFFGDPFADGRAEQISPDELTRYTFEAFQSWAWERGLGRQPQETPLEFTERVVEEIPPLEHEARRLALLYARVAYARGRLGEASLAPLREFWQRLPEVQHSPLSA